MTDTAALRDRGTPSGAHNVQARGIGFGSSLTTVQVVAGQSASVNFSLTPAATELTPMVVTGYGEQERRIVTGSFSTVSAAQLQDIPTSDPMKALQGHVAGASRSSRRATSPARR